MEVILGISIVLILILNVYASYLKRQIRVAHKEFAEFKSQVVMVPVPKRKQSPWMPLLSISIFVMAIALVVMALR